MSSKVWFVPLLLLATGVALADEEPKAEPAPDATEAQAPKKEGTKSLSGMSILGNQEAPKSLVIVPWKSSALGSSLGIAPLLDDSRQPVDRDVFMRALSYYEIRSETTKPATAAHRSKS
jgi:hypothetical protein